MVFKVNVITIGIMHDLDIKKYDFFQDKKLTTVLSLKATTSVEHYVNK